MQASAHSSTEPTSQPVSPSSIWATIPPTRPATIGLRLPERLGHRQAEALLIDFCSTASECTWNAFTSTAPTLFMLHRM